MGAQKNRLIQTVLLSTHKIYFGREIKTVFNYTLLSVALPQPTFLAGQRSAFGNMSGYRCVSDCRSRGLELDPSPVPYFRGD